MPKKKKHPKQRGTSSLAHKAPPSSASVSFEPAPPTTGFGWGFPSAAPAAPTGFDQFLQAQLQMQQQQQMQQQLQHQMQQHMRASMFPSTFQPGLPMSGFFGTTQAGSDNQFSPLFMQGATNTATASHNDSETNEEQRRERKRSNNRSTQRGSTGQTSTNKRNNSTKHEAGSRNVASAMDLTELAQIKPALRESDPTEAVETSPRLPAAHHLRGGACEMC